MKLYVYTVSMMKRFWNWFAPEDPAPSYSRLDRMDGLGVTWDNNVTCRTNCRASCCN